MYTFVFRDPLNVPGVPSRALSSLAYPNKSKLFGPSLDIKKAREIFSWNIKEIPNGFSCWIASFMHKGCRETFGKRKNTRAAGQLV